MSSRRGLGDCYDQYNESSVVALSPSSDPINFGSIFYFKRFFCRRGGGAPPPFDPRLRLLISSLGMKIFPVFFPLFIFIPPSFLSYFCPKIETQYFNTYFEQYYPPWFSNNYILFIFLLLHFIRRQKTNPAKLILLIVQQEKND